MKTVTKKILESINRQNVEFIDYFGEEVDEIVQNGLAHDWPFEEMLMKTTALLAGDSVEKAGYDPGTKRTRSDGTYEKQNDGSWVKLKDEPSAQADAFEDTETDEGTPSEGGDVDSAREALQEKYSKYEVSDLADMVAEASEEEVTAEQLASLDAGDLAGIFVEAMSDDEVAEIMAEDGFDEAFSEAYNQEMGNEDAGPAQGKESFNDTMQQQFQDSTARTEADERAESDLLDDMEEEEFDEDDPTSDEASNAQQIMSEVNAGPYADGEFAPEDVASAIEQHGGIGRVKFDLIEEGVFDSTTEIKDDGWDDEELGRIGLDRGLLSDPTMGPEDEDGFDEAFSEAYNQEMV